MKQQTRELLVTTKVAQNWKGNFEQKVDELMSIVSRVDNDQQVQQACEMMDVYHNNKRSKKPSRRKKISNTERPFEFLVFRN